MTTTPRTADRSPTRPADPPAPTRTARTLAALVAGLTLVTLELVRASGPLLDMTFGLGVVEAAVAAVVAYGVLPGLLGLGLHLAARRSPHRAVVLGVVVLAALRLVLQPVTGWPRFAVGLVAVALAVAVLASTVTLLSRHTSGGQVAGRAVAAGAAGAVGLQLLLGTWDAVWRDGAAGWGVAVAVAAGLLLLAGALRRLDHRDRAARGVAGPDGVGTAPGRVWALGPALALLAAVLANAAFSASQSGVPMAVAGPVTAVGLLLAATLAQVVPAPGAGPDTGSLHRVVPWLEAVLLVVAVAVLLPPRPVGPGLDAGAVTLVALVVAQVLTARVLGRALTDRAAATGAAGGATPAGPALGWSVRTAVLGASAVGLGTIVPLLLHQLDYDVPLGFPNALVVVATALVLALATAGRHRPRGTTAGAARGSWPVVLMSVAGPGRAIVALSALLVLAGSVVAVQEHRATQAFLDRTADIPRLAPGTEPGQGRFLTWNLHYGVDPYGDVDLEQLARTIDRTGADVLLLQEVSRGWVLGGGTDMATWLAQRLDMHVVFAPAADRQFGNAILARRPITDVEVLELPYGDGPQHRSAVRASVPVSTTRVDVVSVHLQHRAANTPTRLAQLETLIDAVGQDTPLVIGGDLNAEPGWPEIDVLTAAGFVSAQDEAGDPDVPTSPTLDPRHRIDWLFTRGVEPLRHAVLVDAFSSDHRPLVTDVAVE